MFPLLQQGVKAKTTRAPTTDPTISSGGEASSSTRVAAPPAKRARKSGEERAYPQGVLKALKEGTPLYANRRGIVPGAVRK